jgi:hypothetical protein
MKINESNEDAGILLDSGDGVWRNVKNERNKKREQTWCRFVGTSMRQMARIMLAGWVNEQLCTSVSKNERINEGMVMPITRDEIGERCTTHVTHLSVVIDENARRSPWRRYRSIGGVNERNLVRYICTVSSRYNQYQYNKIFVEFEIYFPFLI